jgi:hypothetical protein
MPAGPAPRVRGMIRPAYGGQCDTIPAGHGPGRGKRLPANPVPVTDGTTSDAVMPSPASSRATTPAWRLTRAVVAAYPPTAGRRTPELTFMMRPVSCARMSGNTAGLLRTLTTFGSGGAGRRRRNRAGRAGIRGRSGIINDCVNSAMPHQRGAGDTPEIAVVGDISRAGQHATQPGAARRPADHHAAPPGPDERRRHREAGGPRADSWRSARDDHNAAAGPVDSGAALPHGNGRPRQVGRPERPRPADVSGPSLNRHSYAAWRPPAGYRAGFVR